MSTKPRKQRLTLPQKSSDTSHEPPGIFEIPSSDEEDYASHYSPLGVSRKSSKITYKSCRSDCHKTGYQKSTRQNHGRDSVTTNTPTRPNKPNLPCHALPVVKSDRVFGPNLIKSHSSTPHASPRTALRTISKTPLTALESSKGDSIVTAEMYAIDYGSEPAKHVATEQCSSKTIPPQIASEHKHRFRSFTKAALPNLDHAGPKMKGRKRLSSEATAESSSINTINDESSAHLARTALEDPSFQVLGSTKAPNVGDAHSRNRSCNSNKSPSASPNRIAAGTTTPRQARVWDRLLDSSPAKERQRRRFDRSEDIFANANLTPGSDRADNLRSTDSDLEFNKKMPRKRLIDSLTKATPSWNKKTLQDAHDIGSSESADVDHELLSIDHGLESSSLHQEESGISKSSNTNELRVSTGQIVSRSVEGAPKFTYSHQRSYLTESLSEDRSILEETLQDLPISRASKVWDSGNQHEDSISRHRSLNQADDDDKSGRIRSIHELREAGCNKRFLDESEALFEDIVDCQSRSISRRRSALLDLVTKLADEQYASRFIAQSLDQRLLQILGSENDVFNSVLLASAVLFLVQGRTTIPMVMRVVQEGGLKLLTRLLNVDQDIGSLAKSRRRNSSKSSISESADFGNLMLRSFNWAPQYPSTISPRMVGLKCLEALVRQIREAGIVDRLLPEDTLSHITRILPMQSNDVEFDQTDEAWILDVNLALAVLESDTINMGALAQAYSGSEPKLLAFTGCLVFLYNQRDDRFKRAQVLILRLILNATNNNTIACQIAASREVLEVLVKFVTSGFQVLSVSSTDEHRLSTLDQLILALATMINFVEWSELVRSRFLSEHVGEQSFLSALLKTFFSKIENAWEADSMEESHSNVAFGYLAVLLGNLCLDVVLNQHVRELMPERSLRPLIGAIEEFLLYHKRVEDQSISSGNERNSEDGFVDRLQDLIRELAA